MIGKQQLNETTTNGAANVNEPNTRNKQKNPASKRRNKIYLLVNFLLVIYLAIFLMASLDKLPKDDFDFLAIVPYQNKSKQNNSTNTIEIKNDDLTTNFTFPSREERLKYYMGDWFDRKLSPSEATNVCAGYKKDVLLSNKEVLWSAVKLKQQFQAKSKQPNHWLALTYLKDAYIVLNSTTNDTAGIAPPEQIDGGDFVLYVVGDFHSHNDHLPAVAKTRFSKFATAKTTGKPFFKSIIWPVGMIRHYSEVDEYVKLLNQSKVPKWEDKNSTLVWRGGLTGYITDKNVLSNYVHGGPRVQALRAHFRGNRTDVDVALQKRHDKLPSYLRDVGNMFRNQLSLEDQLKYKYILNIEGNDVSTGLKWQLASNSVVFMPRPTKVSFAMEDILLPFVHYVPVKDDFSDLVEMVEWARKNDEKCKWISEQATLFMEKLWMSEEAKRENELVKKDLATTYRRQFKEALSKCVKGGKRRLQEYVENIVEDDQNTGTQFFLVHFST